MKPSTAASVFPQIITLVDYLVNSLKIVY